MKNGHLNQILSQLWRQFISIKLILMQTDLKFYPSRLTVLEQSTIGLNFNILRKENPKNLMSIVPMNQ